MIKREYHLNTISGLISRHPVVGIIGARQVGKTTLARKFTSVFKGKTHYFDLENPEDLARLQDPMLALKRLEGLVVIDEIQRIPDIFEVLRVLVDRPDSDCRFLVLGSASPELLRQSSETLAGRIIYHRLPGFSLEEVGISNFEKLWLRGCFPRSYLAESLDESNEWRTAFISTFLQRDLPQLGINISSATMRRFWMMLSHYHGQIWNASEFGRSFGVADTTVRRYLDILSSAMIVKQFQPWHENLSKRQVKSPKIYINDSGILHTLLKIETLKDLEAHPKLGASWEGFVVGEVIRHLKVEKDSCFFWATHAGADLDLFINRGKDRLGIEVKRTSSPSITPSMRSALEDLNLKHLYVIHAGEHSFPMSENIKAVAIGNLLKDLKPLK